MLYPDGSPGRPEKTSRGSLWVVGCFALLFAYPWVLLTIGTLAYLVSLPFGYLSYRGYERRFRESHAETEPPAMHSPPIAGGFSRAPDTDGRPPRLN